MNIYQSLCFCADLMWSFMKRLQLSHLAHCVMYETVAHWAQTRRKLFGEFRKALANMINDEMIWWDELVPLSCISQKGWLAPQATSSDVIRKCHSNYHMFDYYSLSGMCEIKQNEILFPSAICMHIYHGISHHGSHLKSNYCRAPCNAKEFRNFMSQLHFVIKGYFSHLSFNLCASLKRPSDILLLRLCLFSFYIS